MKLYDFIRLIPLILAPFIVISQEESTDKQISLGIYGGNTDSRSIEHSLNEQFILSKNTSNFSFYAFNKTKKFDQNFYAGSTTTLFIDVVKPLKKK